MQPASSAGKRVPAGHDWLNQSQSVVMQQNKSKREVVNDFRHSVEICSKPNKKMTKICRQCEKCYRRSFGRNNDFGIV